MAVMELSEAEQKIREEYGFSLYNAPKTILREYGFVRIEEGKAVRIKPMPDIDLAEKRVEELKIHASDVLNRARGYIHANDKEDIFWILNSEPHEIIHHQVAGSDRMNKEGLDTILNVAIARRAQGIPAMWTPSRENVNTSEWMSRQYHRFPTVDSTINITSTATHNPPEYGYGSRSSNSRIHEWARRTVAEPELVRKELISRIEDIYQENFTDINTKLHVLEHADQVAQSMLEDAMKIKFDPIKHKPYHGDALNIIGNRFWYTNYSKKDQERIVNDYWDAFTEDFLNKAHFVEPSTTSQSPFSDAPLIALLYEEQTPSWVRRRGQAIVINHDEAALEGIRAGDMRFLKSQGYDQLEAETRKALREYNINKIHEINPSTFFAMDLDEETETLGIPRNQREELYETRRTFLESITDFEFLRIAQDVKGKLISKQFDLAPLVKERTKRIIEMIPEHENMNAKQLVRQTGLPISYIQRATVNKAFPYRWQ